MENIQLSEFELKQIEEIRKGYSDITNYLGQIEMQITMLNKQKASVIEQINEFQTKEVEFNNLLKYKYGEGQVDIETGTFIPSV